jgi:hypothetical protein
MDTFTILVRLHKLVKTFPFNTYQEAHLALSYGIKLVWVATIYPLKHWVPSLSLFSVPCLTDRPLSSCSR